MPPISGSFSGKITQQFGLPLIDQSNHLLGIAEVNGTQKSPDPLSHVPTDRFVLPNP